ncbi:universal stress protein PHOS32-like [Prosopis cineraria]|uniref:universal stress protein PHOS32-like n=1 Tax=Prosopis cineraria TaxID=364024 RepID=UPI00240FD705|nr:universal stress protein PHOS32-like [Prosopis cineraria]
MQRRCISPAQVPTFGSSGFTVVSNQSQRAEVSMATLEKQVMVVGIDDYEHSTYALQWTLDHFFASGPNPLFKLLLVHAKPSATSVVGLAGPGAADVLPIVDADLRQIAARVVGKAKELCISKSGNDVMVEVVEGDARNVLCDAVERHHASMLVVGSHGYGAIKRAVLGSVSDYCAHHAHCTVMIVKKPKIKH